MLARALGRTPHYVVAGGLAVIFLFPLVWNTWASVSPQPGTAQESGHGLGNYRTLLEYDAGLWQYLLNSTVVSVSYLLTKVTPLAAYLPDIVGAHMFLRSIDVPVRITPVTAALVMTAWVAGLLAVAGYLFQRRDA